MIKNRSNISLNHSISCLGLLCVFAFFPNTDSKAFKSLTTKCCLYILAVLILLKIISSTGLWKCYWYSSSFKILKMPRGVLFIYLFIFFILLCFIKAWNWQTCLKLNIHSLPSLGQIQQADRTHDMEDYLFSLHLSEHSELSDRAQWQQVHAQHSRCLSSVTTLSSQVPLHNRCEALQVEINNNKDNGSCDLELSLRLSWAIPCINTASIKKRRQVTVIGDFLLRETEGSICRLSS